MVRSMIIRASGFGRIVRGMSVIGVALLAVAAAGPPAGAAPPSVVPATSPSTGTGTGTERPQPLGGDALAGAETAAAVSAGAYHSCVLTTAGGVKCWGYDQSGQVGDGGGHLRRLWAVDVVGLTSGVAMVSAGDNHTCVVTTRGGVKCWGGNVAGQLGDGTTTDRATPVDVVGLSSGVASVTAGSISTCALTTGGAVKCWGYNGAGELGDGTTKTRLTPVDVVGLTSGVRQVTVSMFGLHACALTTVGVECWGLNLSGQLGDGTHTRRTTPTVVAKIGPGITSVSAGGLSTCAISSSGRAWCWGDNIYGQLGTGDYIGRRVPTPVTGLTTRVTGISVGGFHTCAAGAGMAWCWGYGDHGALGNGIADSPTSPVAVALPGVATVSAGVDDSCAVNRWGRAFCWGYNRFGEVGDGTVVDRLSPVPVVALNH